MSLAAAALASTAFFLMPLALTLSEPPGIPTIQLTAGPAGFAEHLPYLDPPAASDPVQRRRVRPGQSARAPMKASASAPPRNSILRTLTGDGKYRVRPFPEPRGSRLAQRSTP